MRALKTRASGTMTESAFISFVKSALRNKSRFWAPISNTIKKARTRKGFYLCAGCQQEVPKSIVINGKRINNIHCDHIAPVIPPEVGFTTWDSFINNLFCEEDNLQILCYDCDRKKQSEERAIRSNNKKEQ